MRVELDATGQVVRLDDEGFEALVDAHRGAAAPAGLSAALAAPGVARALDAVSAPLVQVRVDVAGPAVTQSHRLWVDLEAAAVLLAVRGDERQLLVTAPQGVAAAVARVVRLGPRRVGAREPVPIEGDVLVDLFHADEMRRRSALVVAGVGLAWTLTVGWQGGSRLMSVTDGDAGLHLVEPTGTGWQLVPTDATRLWRRLTTLLPADDELRAAQAVAAR